MAEASTGTAGASVAQRIRQHRRAIVDAWRVAVRATTSVGKLPEPELVDHIPQMLERIASLAEHATDGTSDRSVTPPESNLHALQRLEQGVRLADVVKEYGILRQCVFEVVGAAGGLDAEQTILISRAIDRAMFVTAERYEDASNRLFRAIDALSTDIAAGQPLEDILRALLDPMMSVSGAIDSCTILLCDGATLRVRAQVGLFGEREAAFTIPVGRGFAGTIAASGEPLMLRDAANDPLVVSEFIRERGIRALYGVPLRRRGEVIGVAHIGSLTSYEFSDEEKLLFRAIVERATAFVIEAQLREEQMAARRAAEQQASVVRGILQASVDAISVFDHDGRYVYASTVAATALGVSTEQMIGRRVEELPLPADAARATLAAIRCAIDTGTPQRVVATLRGSDRERVFECLFSAIPAADGAPRYAISVGRDITEREAAQAMLRDREMQLGVALDAGRLGTWDWRAAPSTLHLDERARTILGISGEAALPELLATLHPADRDRLSGVVDAARSSADGRFDCDVRLGRRDRERWMCVEGRVLFDERRNPTRIIGIVHDITDRRRADVERENAARMADVFLGVLGHDLRAPLSAITLASGLLLRKSASPDVTRAAGRIASSADRMSRMISDLLDYSRVRAGQPMPLQRERVSLLALCESAADELELVYPNRTIEISAGGDAVGEWDRGRLSQVITNLLSNALRYSTPDSTVAMRIGADDESASLEVHNEGPPIPAELLPHLFDAYRKGANSGARSDSVGLGLFIVRAIVAAHGGSIEVASRTSEGTTLTMRLPRHAPRNG